MKIRFSIVLTLTVIAMLAVSSSGLATSPTERLQDEPTAASAINVQLDLVGHIGGKCGDIHVRGAWAYASCGNELGIYDVSDPANPSRKSGVLLPGFGWDVDVLGDYAYVTNFMGGMGRPGLTITDISDPAHPQIVGQAITSETDVRGVQVVGDYAFLAAESYGLLVIDISDPTTPAQVADLATEPLVRAIRVNGDYAYLANGDNGLYVIDISDPLNPSQTGHLALPGTSRGLAVTDNYAYVATQMSDFDAHNLRVVDISNPASPSELGSIRVLIGYPGMVNSVAADGNVVYVSGSAYVGSGRWYGGLESVDVSDPTTPKRHTNFVSPQIGEAYGLHLSGNQAYMAAYEDGLLIVDITDPKEMTETAHYGIPTSSNSVAVDGNMAYLADGWMGAMTLDISQPASPFIVGSIGSSAEKNSSALEIELVDQLVYLADYGGGLRILDVSDPTNIEQIGAYFMPDGPDWSQRVHVEDQYAYLVDYFGYRMHIFDISDPTDPRPVGAFGDVTEVYLVNDVFVVGQYAYTAGNGFRVIDVSDPTKPEEIGHDPAVVQGKAVQIEGNYAYVIGDGDKFWILDISDPTKPEAITTFTLPFAFSSSLWIGQHPTSGERLAYIGTSYNGLLILDISDHSAPVEVGTFEDVRFIADVRAYGPYVYLAAGEQGFYIMGHRTLQVTPSEIFWLAEVNGSGTFPRMAQVKSSGQAFTWTAEISPTAPWLTISPVSGTTPAGISVTSHISGLALGTYTSTLIVAGPEGLAGSPAQVPVTLEVLEKVYGVFLPLIIR